MEEEFRALLLAGLPAVQSTRINWGQHLQMAGGPYLVIHLIAMSRGHTQQGPDRLERARVQVDCYAADFGTVNGIGRAVRDVLDFYRGGNFRGIFFDTMRQTRESGDTAGEAVYRASLDFLTHWRQPDG